MSILSTNKKLIKVGAEYSAGSGISIDNYVISVTGDVGGKTYSAGDNINIYEQDNQLYISGKDWEQDIANASANAYEQAVAQIPQPQDLSFISAQVDNKLNSSDFTDWQNGQYTTDLQTIEGQINNKLDSSSFSDVSGNFLTAINIPESATWNETSNVVKEGSANWDNTSDVVKESSASWNQGKTYEGISPIVVNNDENKVSADTWTFSAGSNVSFVDDNVNKITRIDVELPQPQDLSYISAQTDKANQGVDYLSGVVITALPSDMATTGDVAELAQTISETYYPNTNPSSFVNEDWVTAQGYITGVDLSEYAKRTDVLSSIESATSGKLDVSSFASVSSDFLTNEDLDNYYTKSETSGADQLADAFANIPAGDVGVNTYVQNNSATINEVNTTYQENSGAYLTAVDLTPYQTIEDMTAYQPVSSMTSYANRFQLISVSSNLSAAIHSLDESVTTGVVGNLHNYDIKGLNLYGVTSTSSYNSTGYVPTFTSNNASHNSTATDVFGLTTANMSQWNGKSYVSISSNGNTITGNYKCKVFYLFDGIADKSWHSKNPFSGEVGILDKDNLVVYNNYVKPSYFTNNGISNFNTKIVFSANDGGYHPFDVVLTFGDLGVTATNTISGIFVPSAVNLSNYYKKTETSSKQQISNAVNNLFNYFNDSNQYVQGHSGMIDLVTTSYLTSGGLFLDCYNNVNTNSGDWSQGGGDVPEDVMVESAIGYNAVNEISGYNGSAIAQYGVEKQWLVHDDTLVHAANSAQYALGVNVSALQRLMGIDETVLFFVGNESSGVQSGNLTESIKNFKRIRVAGMDNDGHTDVKYIYPAWTKNADGFSTSGYEVILYGANPYSQQSTIWEKWTRYSFSALTSFNIVLSYEGSYTANSVNNVTNNHKNSIREVVGIGRING